VDCLGSALQRVWQSNPALFEEQSALDAAESSCELNRVFRILLGLWGNIGGGDWLDGCGRHVCFVLWNLACLMRFYGTSERFVTVLQNNSDFAIHLSIK